MIFTFDLLEPLDPLGMGELLAHSLNNEAILNGIASNLFESFDFQKKILIGYFCNDFDYILCIFKIGK